MEIKYIFSKLLLAIISINILANTPLFGITPDKEKDKCPICITEFESNDDVINLNCPGTEKSKYKHIFHIDCIKGWINMSCNSCPTCRHKHKTLNLDSLKEKKIKYSQVYNNTWSKYATPEVALCLLGITSYFVAQYYIRKVARGITNLLSFRILDF